MLKKYVMGRKAEYELMDFLRKHYNMVCVRSAGSHTPCDLICGNGLEVWVVQVKYGENPRISKGEVQKLIDYAYMFMAKPIVALRKKRGKWEFKDAYMIPL